jgi:hypothetical protein
MVGYIIEVGLKAQMNGTSGLLFNHQQVKISTSPPKSQNLPILAQREIVDFEHQTASSSFLVGRESVFRCFTLKP